MACRPERHREKTRCATRGEPGCSTIRAGGQGVFPGRLLSAQGPGADNVPGTIAGGTLTVSAPTTTPTSSADGVTWDLSDLYAGLDDPALTRDLDAALQRARVFETVYRGKINADGGPPPGLLLTALTELEGLSEQMDRPIIFASLTHAAKTDDPRHGALLARTRGSRTRINQHLLFFDL